MSARACPLAARWVLLAGAALLSAAPARRALAQAGPVTVDVVVSPRPTTFGPLSIRRVQLQFAGGRAEAVVPLRGSLGARATIDYSGTGVLAGRWVVDGRPLEEFQQALSFGSTLSLETAAVPGLPTFEPGRHEVSLQLTAPPAAFAMPVITYVVEAAAAPGRGAIELVLPAADAVVPVPSRPAAGAPGIAFEWVQAGAPAPRYRLELGRRLAAEPDAAAFTTAPRYVLPAAIAAGLVRGARYTWRVRALDASGAELAVSPTGVFTTRPASPIELVSPAEGERVRFPAGFRWTSGVAAASHEVRIHRNEEALQADLAEQQRGPRGARVARLPGAPDPSAWAPLLTARANPGDSAVKVELPAGSPIAPGMALRWVVVARDAAGGFVAASDPGGFVVEPPLRTLNGLPAILEMAGQEIEARSYGAGSTAAALAGTGVVRFRLDRSRREVPLSFRGLAAETWVERRRTVAGAGLQATVTYAETLRGRITSGRIDERPAQPVPLDLAGYTARLSGIRLREEPAASGAAADLAIDLPAYARTPAGGTATLLLADTRLAPGGDFYRELGPAEAPDVRLEASAAGPIRFARLGTVVADFAAGRDWAGPAGARPADGEILAAGGAAELSAAALFPAIRTGPIRLGNGVAALLPAGFGASFEVVDSDPVEPLVPAGYELLLTGGRLALAGGAVDPATLRLDGRAALPAVERPPAGAAIVPFQGLAVAGGWLEAAVRAGDLQWGIVPAPASDRRSGRTGGALEPARAQEIAAALGIAQEAPEPRPFVLRGGAGRLRLPFGATSPDRAQAGLLLSAGTLEGPFELEPGAMKSALPEDAVSLRVAAAGVSGTVASAPPAAPPGGIGGRAPLVTRGRTARAGDFGATVTDFRVEWADGAVVSSAVAGELRVPPPVDLRLPYRDAALSGTGDLLAPTLTLPAEVPLAWWRASVAPTGSDLSRSWLRLRGGTLRLAVPAAAGGDEMGRLGLRSLEIGANGQILGVATDTAATFLGIPFTLASETALSFGTWTGVEPSPSQALVTAPGALAFPVMGAKQAVVEHTATGASVRLLDPAYARGSPELIRITGDLVYVNGHLRGGTYKEFLGQGRISVLEALQLNGMVSVGSDAQGIYERYGLGLGVDVDKAAALYQGGFVSLAGKLGAGVVGAVTDKDPHASEVAVLVGDVAKLATGANKGQAEMTQGMFKALADAVRLARSIHLDTGGQTGDAVETSLSLAAATLSLAADLSAKKGTVDARQLAVLAVKGLDVAFPILERSGFAKDQPETLAVLGFVRMAVKATGLWLDDGKLSDKDWFAISRQLVTSAKNLSTDRSFQVAMEVMAAVFAAAEQGGSSPEVVYARIGSAVLGAFRTAQALPGNDWKNVLVLSQALLDGAVAAQGLPAPENAIEIARKVLDAAAGTETDFGQLQGKDVNRPLKLAFRLARRTLDAWSAAAGGIPYDKAAQSVKDAWDTAAAASDFSGGPRFGVHETVWRLVDVWDRMKARPLAESLVDLRQLLCDAGGDLQCATPATFESQVSGVLQDAAQAQAPAALLGSMTRLQGLAAWAGGAGIPAGGGPSYLDRMRGLVRPAAAGLRARAADLTARSLMPAVAAATKLAEAGAVARLAGDLASRGVSIDAVLGAPELAWRPVVEEPVAAALDARIVGQFGREVRAQAAATSDPRALGDLWVAWRNASWLVSDAPHAAGRSAEVKREVERAFAARGGALYEACARRIEDEPLAQWSLAKLCLDELLKLPGTLEASALVSVAPMAGTLGEVIRNASMSQTGAVSTARMFVLHLLLLGGVFLEIDAMAKEMAEVPTSRAAPDPIRRWIESSTPADGSAVGRLLDAALQEARSGAIGQGTVLAIVLARGVHERGVDLGPDAVGRLAELQRELLPLADRTFARELDATNPETSSISEGLGHAAFYALLARLPGRTGAQAALDAKVPGWIAAAKELPCNRRMERGAWLRAVAPFVPGKYADIQTLMGVLHRGCTSPSYDPSAEIAKVVRSGNELRQAVDGIAAGPMTEADKKEAIAWAIAERLETLTAGFKGEIAEDRVLRAAHEQIALVRKHRLGTRAERVAAVGEVLGKALDEVGAGGAIPAVNVVTAVLGEFVRSGAEQKPPYQRVLEIATIAISQNVPSGPGKVLLGAWLGLLQSSSTAARAGGVAVVAVPALVAAGVGLAVKDKIKISGGRLDVPATLAALGLQGEFWEAVGALAPDAVETAIAAKKLHDLLEELRKAAAGSDAAARVAALRKFVEEAPKLQNVGKYVGAVLKPEAHLLAPDTDQRDPLANALLAVLGTARQDVPGSAAMPNKGTCAAVALPVAQGGSAQRGKEVLVCAIDYAREIVRGFVALALGGSPNPYQLMNEQARQQAEQIRRDSVFARAVGDEGLSGLSGGLEYRGGQFSRFELFASIDVEGLIETTMLAEYDARQTLFRLRLANVDPRPQGALDRLGLTNRANMLLSTGVFQNPVKTFDVTVSGRRRCFASRLALGLETPLGGYMTGEQGLDVCWNPFALDLQVRARVSPMPPFAGEATLRLCYGSGNVGLDLGALGGIDVPEIIPEPVFVDGWGRTFYLKQWGLFANVGLSAGLTAGLGGLEVRGGASASIGVRVTEKDEPNCVGQPLVLGALFPGDSFEQRSTYTTSSGRTIAYGLCRSSFGAAAEFRAGTASFQGFYVKSRTSVDLGVATASMWTYKSGPTFDWGVGDFPADRYGGWGASGSSPPGAASVCGVAR